MVCRACGKESADDSTFCPYCGKQKIAEVVCHACGNESAAEFNFCPHCGEAFGPKPSVIEPPSPSPEVRPVNDSPPDESESQKDGVAGTAIRVGTLMFGAFSAISLLVSIVKGLVPIYLLESAGWAGGAWYWQGKKTHSDVAKAFVIVLAVLVATGEVVHIASQPDSKSTAATESDLFEKYALPGGSSNASDYDSVGTADQNPKVATSTASATSHVADVEKQMPSRLKGEQEKAEQEETAGLQDLHDHATERFNQGLALYDQKRYEEARPLFQRACDGGILNSCTWVGALYQDGQGIQQDYSQARTYYQKACEGGDINGCEGLGNLYLNGLGVMQDFAQALTLYKRACDGGDMNACIKVGNSYRDGHGVPQDFAKAGDIYRRACDIKNMAGCNNLGNLYADGDGVARDYAEARTLYEKACDGGIMAACEGLGNIYYNGEGVAQDIAKARSLYKASCDGGFDQACASLRGLP